MAYKRTPSGQRTQEIAMTNPGTRQKNADGGYDVPRVPLSPPTAWAKLEVATPKALERTVADTTIGVATHVVTIPYHPQVTLKTDVAWIDRAGGQHHANVLGYSNPDQSAIETVMIIAEIIR
jgi:hypothetical protein